MESLFRRGAEHLLKRNTIFGTHGIFAIFTAMHDLLLPLLLLFLLLHEILERRMLQNAAATKIEISFIARTYPYLIVHTTRIFYCPNPIYIFLYFMER